MGSDAIRRTVNSSFTRFNSRSRMGSDADVRASNALSEVSIHAPAWGATRRHCERKPPETVSIHAPAWGATREALTRGQKQWFQFTLPHGERLANLATIIEAAEFQFTLPHGERQCTDGPQRPSERVSIHAPAWGATSEMSAYWGTLGVSIHAPAWGATASPAFWPALP